MKRPKQLATRIRLMKQINVKEDLLIGVLAGTMLAAIFITLQWGRQVVAAGPPLSIPGIADSVLLPKTPLTAESSPEDIIALMLNSHTQWRTLEASAVTTINNDQLGNNSWQTNIQLEQYGKGRGSYGHVGLEPDFTWVSNGETLWKARPVEKVYTSNSLPEDIKIFENYGPVSPPTEDGQAFVVGHPLDGVFPSMLSSFAFPHGLAQSFQERTLEVIGSDIVAGRDAVVILSQLFDQEGTLIKKHEYWVDANTGVILRSQIYAESSGWDQWYEQTNTTEITYDVTFPSHAFQFKPESDMKQTSPDTFDSVRGN